MNLTRRQRRIDGGYVVHTIMLNNEVILERLHDPTEQDIKDALRARAHPAPAVRDTYGKPGPKRKQEMSDE
jgi:hypothetical protein